ncbi:hypothetical protein BO78DRAFT_400946 [Aspergillus sclerotiicarbonarius CBS 121057]|uniref:Uncharacterized protein n=1 Tax=Aspergillus sclerotiicarbonarius (strain CBS 121057 / IBT 28362) TaxID=1448318 RepID=A0A319DVZ2_ASPSB|nr:hypothetical protein BO78DRAFT_400946 [Aspergillus sclerotiicarbonarius CBS 121057]
MVAFFPACLLVLFACLPACLPAALPALPALPCLLDSLRWNCHRWDSCSAARRPVATRTK